MCKGILSGLARGDFNALNPFNLGDWTHRGRDRVTRFWSRTLLLLAGSEETFWQVVTFFFVGPNASFSYTRVNSTAQIHEQKNKSALKSGNGARPDFRNGKSILGGKPSLSRSQQNRNSHPTLFSYIFIHSNVSFLMGGHFKDPFQMLKTRR